MSDVEAVASAWRAFDLEGRRAEFDQQGLEIAEQQDAAVKSRQNLASETKAFRKLADEEKLAGFGGLLKLYQQEVDKLSKRSRFSENAFLTLYKSLYELPDCVPYLLEAQGSKAKVVELSREVEDLTSELKEYTGEMKELRNQDVTVRKWQERCRELEQEVEQARNDLDHAEHLKGEANTVVQSIRDECDLKLAEARESELSLEEDCRRLRNELAKTKNEVVDLQTEVFDLKSRFDEETQAKQSELDIFAEDIERANARISTLEKEKESLETEVELARHESARNAQLEESAQRSAVLEADLEDKAKRLKDAKDIIRQLKKEFDESVAASQQEIATCEEENKKLKEDLKNMEEELKALPSTEEYDALQQRLAVLEAVQGISDNAGDDGATGSGVEGKGVLNSVEEQLLAKKRSLESQLTKTKVLLDSESRKLQEKSTQLAACQKELAESKKLAVSLEESLSKSTAVTNDASAPQEASILSSAVGQEHDATGGGGEGGPSVHDQSMLNVIISQRDRFKARIKDLESENRKLVEKEDSRERELRQLRDDNVKLYEKIRFLKSYQGQGASSGNGAGSKEYDIEMAPSIHERTEVKYRNLYERKVDPFASFKDKELTDEYDRLNLAEKTIYQTSNYVLATKKARMILFGYSVFLHLLLFYTMYTVEHLECKPRH